ncbi:hypothetical protein [Candidatus Poriferisocius sp.]|uniref:hypothetical protein n=1 Tax=Candidatus Poriferisocius sp. TaxID=3101276 RepID=UPI003B01376D
MSPSPGSTDPLRRWKPGAWGAEAIRNLVASPGSAAVLVSVLALVYWFSAHADQREVEALVRSEQRLQHEGAWVVVALASDEGATVSGEACGALSTITGVLGTGTISHRNARAITARTPAGPELAAGELSPSLAVLLSGREPPPGTIAVVGRGAADRLGLTTGSRLGAKLTGMEPHGAVTRAAGEIAVADLTRLGVISDRGLWLLRARTGEVESCVVEFAPWVDDNVQRAVASLAAGGSRPPDLSRFTRVPEGEDSLPHRYANRSTRLLPLGAAAVVAVVVFGSMARRRSELALYRLTGASPRSAKLVIMAEISIAAVAAFCVATAVHLATRSTGIDHGLVAALRCLTATAAAVLLVGITYSSGSVASAIKDA